MSEHFVVEADRRVVGIAVRVRGGFRFFTSNARFKDLESQTFPRARSIYQRIEQMALARKSARRIDLPGGS